MRFLRYRQMRRRTRGKQTGQFTRRDPTKKILSKNFGEKRLKVNCVTWNLEGKGSPQDVDSILNQNKNQNIKIICLQEANLPSTNGGTENYHWFCAGTFGSAILISKSSDLKSNSFEQLCEQICVLELEDSSGIQFKVISCYIPPLSNYQNTDLWSKLIELIKTLPSNVAYVLAGDFNALIGKSDETDKDSKNFGRLLYDDISNENGVQLKKFVRASYLKVVNTFKFSPDKNHECYTYKDDMCKNLRDLIMVSISRSILATDIFSSWYQNYKHAMVGCGLTISKMVQQTFSSESKTEEIQTKKPLFLFGSWNIQATTPAKVDKILNEQDLPLVCIQELFLTSDEDIKTDNYTWYSSKKQWTKNVGLLVKSSTNISVTNFEPLSEFLCVADVDFCGVLVKVISCQLPRQSDENEQVVTQLVDLIKSVPEGTFTVLGGDFSGKTEITEDDEKNNEVFDFLENLEGKTSLKVLTTMRGRYKEKSKSYFTTQITEKYKSSPHHILTLLSNVANMKINSFYRWIPFYQNCIVCACFKEKNISDGDTVKDQDLQNRGATSSENVFATKREIIDGMLHKTKVFGGYEVSSDDEGDLPDDKFLLTPEDIEKFKHTPVGPEDLSRILKDFVLFHGPNSRSCIANTPLFMIVNSFKRGKFGKLIFEDTDIMDEDAKTTIRRTCKIKWNSILLSEQCGTNADRFFKMRKLAINSLISKLSQFFYTVKGKRSFYNKSQPPILMNDSSFAEVIKVMEKKTLPTMPDVLKYINDFFSKETDCELVFGKDFTEENLKEIRSYAKSQKLSYRFFTSTLGLPKMNHIAVYKKYTPMQLRDKLMKNPDNPRFILIPPCGQGVDYEEFNRKYELENYKGEENLFLKHSNKNHQDSKSNIGPKTPALKNIERKRTAASKKSSFQSNGDQNRQFTQSQRGERKRPSSNWENSIWEDGRRREFVDRGARKRPSSNWENSILEDGRRREFDNSGITEQKRQRLDTSMNRMLPRVNLPRWNQLAPLVLVWPITVRSQVEDRSKQILEANFVVDFEQGPQNTVATVVSLPMRNGTAKKYCLSVANGHNKAAHIALQLIVKHSTVIKPSPSYLCNGAAPNFVRYKVPCQTNPRTYIILSKRETGSLSIPVLRELFDTFKDSFNEDVFFDKDGYSYNEKMTIIEQAPLFNLKVRHFGDSPQLFDRYVCVYKKKSNNEILQEVLKMRGFHPKYTLTTDRLPARLGLNIF